MINIWILALMPDAQDDNAQLAVILISQDNQIFILKVPGIPLGVPALGWLENRAGYLWSDALTRGEPATVADVARYISPEMIAAFMLVTMERVNWIHQVIVFFHAGAADACPQYTPEDLFDAIRKKL